jgi:hypothetical protein
MTSDEKMLYTLRQAAQLTSRDIALLRRWAAQGKIKTTQEQGGLNQHLIDDSELAKIDAMPRKGYVRTIRLTRTVRESDGAVQLVEVPVWEKKKTKKKET